ncbi:hypothetical protein [Polyangium aurulentum]|uniref:hypothetical protein n=1 Tax=Polyangium aurulentum TaxID=2567896 RepID=UPI00113B3102|nr:hypothetical protein [Polyangium aurulentum]UQA54686.1 hypothetical protein E8A73_025275 [Polyangium aurulentum]
MPYPTSVYALPRMDLSTGVALGRALLAAASVPPRLPEGIARGRRLLALRLDALLEAGEGRILQATDPGSPIASAGMRLDSAWSGLAAFLEGFTGLSPATPEALEAAVLLASLFPDGLEPLRLPPLLEWSESEGRMLRIARGGLEPPLRALGAGPFLDVITEAHQIYAEALDERPFAETGAAMAPRKLRRELDAFALALHAYVMSTLAELADGEAESEAMASVLLAPLELTALGMGPAPPAWDAPNPLEAS